MANLFLGYEYMTMENTEVPVLPERDWYVCFIKFTQKLEIQVSYMLFGIVKPAYPQASDTFSYNYICCKSFLLTDLSWGFFEFLKFSLPLSASLELHLCCQPPQNCWFTIKNTLLKGMCQVEWPRNPKTEIFWAWQSNQIQISHSFLTRANSHIATFSTNPWEKSAASE